LRRGEIVEGDNGFGMGCKISTNLVEKLGKRYGMKEQE
jgi:hypothetical protein